MSLLTPTADLVAQAARRARLAAVLGQLLVAEPGPELAELARGIPALEPLAAGDPALAVEYERLLLREVPPYESVFLSESGSLGGDTAQAVAETYERHGFDEGAGRWRVAGPDHLGLELRCYASLCASEAEAWEEDRPDLALRAVEAERALLAEHLGQWGQVVASALAERAGGGPYRALAEAVGDFLAEEVDRLRPAPDLPGTPALEARAAPARLGPAALARWLLAPGVCGAWLDGTTLGAAALSLGIPWRPSDPRSQLRKVLEEATDAGDLPELLAHLRPTVEAWRDRHAALESSSPGAARIWRAWRLQAEETLALVDRLSQTTPSGQTGTRPVVVCVGGLADARSTAERLRPLGLHVAVSADLPAAVAELLGHLLDAGAEEVFLGGHRASTLAWRDGGHVSARETRCLPAADVVVRVAPARAPAGLVIEAGHDATTTERVRVALGERRPAPAP